MADMLDGAMVVWFTLTLGAMLFVVGDSIFNGVTSWVQRIAWILVTLTGPVGLFFLPTCLPAALPGRSRPLYAGHLEAEPEQRDALPRGAPRRDRLIQALMAADMESERSKPS